MVTKSEKQVGSDMSTLRRVVSAALLVVLAISFFLAQSATWLNNTIFDRETFSAIGVRTVMEQQNRDAIARAVVNTTLEDRPIAERIVGDRAVGLVSGLLGSDLSQRTVSRTVDGLYGYITSPDRADVAIELGAIRQPLVAVLSLAEDGGRDLRIEPSHIPERIVLVDEDELPDVAGYIKLSVVVAGFLWVLAVVSLLGYVLLNRTGRVRKVYVAISVLAAVSVVGLFTGPFVPPTVASLLANIDLRGLASSLTAAYLAPFAAQLYITIAVLAAGALVTHYRILISDASRSAYQALRKRTHKS